VSQFRPSHSLPATTQPRSASAELIAGAQRLTSHLMGRSETRAQHKIIKYDAAPESHVLIGLPRNLPALL
jgi:hypothetical protein